MANEATEKHHSRLPPETEYRFDRLQEVEYEHCFGYEIGRYRIPRDRARIREELASLATAEMALDDPEDRVYTRSRELQDQLDWLEAEQYERPWLALSKAQREKIIARTGRARSEPVQLSRELGWANRLLLKLGNPDFESVEVTINWREPDERLIDSFRTLLRRMREGYGKATFKVEQARGPKKWPIRHRLFALAVWRCRQGGMTHEQIWQLLEPVRKKLGFSNQRRLGDLTRRIERLIGEEPS